MSRINATLALILFLAGATAGHVYNDPGHRLIAVIAYKILHADAELNPHIATMIDLLEHHPRYRTDFHNPMRRVLPAAIAVFKTSGYCPKPASGRTSPEITPGTIAEPGTT